MTDPAVPTLLEQPLPDAAHEALRLAVVEALTKLQEQVDQLAEIVARLDAADEKADAVASEVDTVKDAVATVGLEVAGVEPEAPWRQPDGAHNAYPTGWLVEFGGKLWTSLLAANVWQPGTSGWREVVPSDSAPPAWVAPTGAHDAYAKGALVTFDGRVWASTVDANVWSPTTFGWTVKP